ncbi:beta-ketoacyl synthase N-terminal-like domain-containing protein [Streptomyces sp. NPDC005322]|uniref:type I polyketide synthase n=1 Tax=Streptomyces sp. NPDC005322 TaxID=3157032 RepID=UPI0033A95315
MQGDTETDIAIVGVGCRLPGAVRDLDAYWDLLASGRSTVTGVPADRWDDRFHDPSPEHPGTSYCPRGSFLEDIDRFDADFFGISPREAHEVDPQQRLLLEASWAAMEDSGVPRGRWTGSRTGVYMGILAADYMVLHAKTAGAERINPYYASGKEFSFGAGRIAYTFGLHGPCLMLNTACSSSLIAVHLAVKALRAGECDAALAGGVNLMLTPELSIFMSKVWALSPSGVCRPFDAAADGVVRSEGCGVVVLKRYKDATADGDRIWAVVHGSAANHDGRSAGLTAPNAVAQQDLLRTALHDAGRSPSDVDFVEAHGTGTPLGDPLELSALSAVLGAGRPADRPLYVGSHKANFGHMDSAAGIAGLLKAILVARMGTTPPQINLERPTPQIDWQSCGLAVPTRATVLRPSGERPLVGVNAFGLSGTNAHVLLGPPPEPFDVPAGEPGDERTSGEGQPAGAAGHRPVLTVSGHTVTALRAQAAAYRDRIRQDDGAPLSDLVHTAAARRTHHEHRLAVVGRTGQELADRLEEYLADRASPSVITGDVMDGAARPIVHVFSGQGSQWPGMGMDLYGAQPVFTETLDACEAHFARYAGWSLLDELRRTEGSRLEDTEIAQPALFAVQLALSRLWASWGLGPDVVVGHSMGEVAAAVVAGTLTLADAAGLIVHRGRLMRETGGSGRMVAVELPADEVASMLEPYGDEVCVAVVNGPASVVIAGATEAVKRATAELKAREARCVPLPVDYAFHSRAVRPHGDELERLLGGLTVRPPEITMLSSVDPLLDVPVTDAAYWGRNVRDTVRFWPAVDRLLEQHDAAFLEIGVHPVLHRPLRSALVHRGRTGPVVSSLSRGEPADVTLGRALGGLHVRGVEPDWAGVNAGRHRYVPLPPLPLGGDSYWLPGVERGRQGGVRTGTEGLRAEVRLLDADGRVVTTLTSSAGTAAAVAPSAPAAVGEPERSGAGAAAPAPAAAAQASGAGGGGTGAPGGRERIAAVVSRICAQVLGHDPGRRVPRIRGFFELGMDSFSLSDFVKALERHFGIELGDSAGIHHPTIDQITDHIALLVADLAVQEKTGAGKSPAPSEPLPSAPPVVPVASGPTARATRPAPPLAQPRPVPAAEPIAVVGMACRMPGADGLEEFWRLLSHGVDASSDIPADRFDAGALLARGTVTPGTIVTGRGSFLDQVDGFDNAFFRISAREARSMDPQQRLFVEVAWEALEDAGVRTAELPGSRVGLYVGLNTTDYMQTVTRNAADIDLYYGTGNSFSGTAGRLSYFLGVRGPSMAVDTACSSSLTAVHQACQALRLGEAQLAIAGGSNVITTPTVYLSMSAAGALSPDGRCKTFSSDADGYGRGEGAGAVVLKTLSRARADGDRVYALLRGSAVNHNGASGGLTVPSAQAQQEVIADALERAGLTGADMSYIEAHGTGTRLGDGVELAALGRALGAGRPADAPLLVGSVKTNIGHLEAAAGIAGLIKTVLILDRGEIPAHLHLREASREVDWDRLPVRVTARPHPWPKEPGRARVAGVSAFGFTGTNAHVVVGEAEPVPVEVGTGPGPRPYLLAVSGGSESALRAAADRMRARLTGAGPAELADICHTAGARRTHLGHRLVVTGANAADLRGALAAYASGGAAAGLHVGSAPPREVCRLVAVYGEETADLPWRRWDAAEPAVAAALDALDAETDRLLGRSARQALHDGAARHGDPVAVLAAQCALTAMWRAYGVRPVAVAGRGTGEIGAACAAGLLDLRDAVRAVGGLSGVRLRGMPSTAVHLDSVAGGGLADWAPPSAVSRTRWSAALVDAVAADGAGLVLGIGLDTPAAELAELARSADVAPGPLRLVPASTDGPYDAQDTLAHAAAELHVRGGAVDWTALLGGPRPVVSLPTYPWQRRRHWIDVGTIADRAPRPDHGEGSDPSGLLDRSEPSGFSGSSAPATPVDTGPTAPAAAAPVAVPHEVPFVAELRALEPGLRADRMLTAVLAAVADALGESSGADVDPDLGFFELGLDSVMAVALTDQLGPRLGTELEPTLTFEHPTSRALAQHLLDTAVGAAPAAPDASAPPAEPGAPAGHEPDDDLADLSDDDLTNRLLARISSSQALLK